MPRPPRKTPVKQEVVIPTTSLVASAVRYPGKVTRIFRQAEGWQKDAYRHYRICGEARYAARFMGQALSRAVLSTDAGFATEVLDLLFSGKDGQKEMLKALGIHLTVAGECWLVGRDVEGQQLWEVVSVLEMHTSGTKWTIDHGEDKKKVELSDNDVVIRIWTPDPAERIAADSPFRSLLPVLDEIEWLSKHIFSQITSRLAGNGILFLPQSMTFPPPPAQDGIEMATLNEAQSFMLSLGDGFLTPLEDPSSPAARIPIVVTAPDESIGKAEWMQFWTELDAQSREMRHDAISRFALGMDLPPEQVLGISSNAGTGGGSSNGVSHWGAWQIEEQTIKMHVEPMLDAVTNALTIGFLRPLLEDTDQPDAAIAYSTEALRLRPDRSREAFELHDRGILSMEALLRENGFAKEDAMKPKEFQQWLLRKVASGSATPEQVQAALAALGVVLETMPVLDPGPVRETRPDPSLLDHPTRPRTPDPALLAASEGLVYRAMERAGNRLRNQGVRPPGVPAYETHQYIHPARPETLLEDAWSCAPQVLDGIAEPETVLPVLNSYCLSLLNQGEPHSRERLAQWLAAQGCEVAA